MKVENKTKQIKQLIRVEINRSIPLSKIEIWTKHLVHEIQRSIPSDKEDIDVVITIDFSANPGIRKHMKKLMMDALEEELLG